MPPEVVVVVVAPMIDVVPPMTLNVMVSLTPLLKRRRDFAYGVKVIAKGVCCTELVR